MNAKKVIRDCPICNSNRTLPAYNNNMATIGELDLSYAVEQCLDCGFFFANHLAAPEVYSAYYKSLSKYDFSPEISEHDRVRFNAAVSLCSGIIEPHAMIVDIGCGNGALLSGFKSAGFVNLFGIDPAPNAAKHASVMFGLSNIYSGSMQDAGLHIALRQADLVCIMAVLEHLWHVSSDLKNIFEQLNPGCKIMVEVPSLEYFDAVNGEPYGEFSLEHIQFFSANSLNNLMLSLGARLIESSFVDLPSISGHSLIGIYQLGSAEDINLAPSNSDIDFMIDYISQSEKRFLEALSKIKANQIIIYGAGSHTARILPRLSMRDDIEVVAVVDSNPNLQGKLIGEHRIDLPEIINQHPTIPILVSSYRSQNEIANSLSQRFSNELILLY